MMTLQEAKNLAIRQIIYHAYFPNADGSPQRWVVNGQVKTWKRDSNRVRVPVKRGLYEFGYLMEDNLHLFCLTEDEAVKGLEIIR